nr:unnamed protein product [Callosobruchus analis]
MEWSAKISSCALSTLQKRKFNHKPLLPLTENLLQRTKYLDEEIKHFREKLSNKMDYKTWRNLASCILSRIILFNKKRYGEASRMMVEQYATRPTFKQQGIQELLMSISVRKAFSFHCGGRLHENAVETIKISHLLLAVEKGEANRYTGKSLDEINIDGE